MAAATTESVVGQAGWAAANQAPFLWQGHSFELLAGRALWDPALALLLVADLHLGKAESFQARGIPLPSDGDAETLNALLQLAHRWRPRQLIVLGDLVHDRLGLTGDLRQKLAALPALLGCPLRLIGGNHDRGHWHEGLPQEPAQALGPLWLSHGPDPRAGLLNVCGHLHPVVQLGRKADRLRLPCFAFDPQRQQLVLPSFGALTGGHPYPQPADLWVVAEGAIVPWPALSRPARSISSNGIRTGGGRV
ncbi:MAG: ligase-associated DNA damage response endonuclease PdeM [Synechococcaceae cyanobacterium ELA739]